MKKENLVIMLVLLIAIASAFALYYTFKPVECAGYDCFQNYMASCARATYLNEETEASWFYEIIRSSKDMCNIRVTLLQPKEGDLNLKNFEGHSMLCEYPLGVVAYPDKDMSRCHGLLKEDLQGLIIEKLHTYIIGNLEEIEQVMSNETLIDPIE